MDADKPKTSINLAQHELDKARADWAAEKVRRGQRDAEVNWVYPGDEPASEPGTIAALNVTTMAQVRRLAEMDRRVAENDALNRIQPGQSEKAKAVWQGECGNIPQNTPLPTIYPKH